MNRTMAAPIRYLDGALTALRSLGFPPPEEVHAPAVAQISKLSKVDEGRVVAIARVLQHSSHVNEVLRANVATARVSDRYAVIIESFDSIRDDAKRMVDQLEDGRLDLKERAQNAWMSFTRGTLTRRFNKIREAYLDVTRDGCAALEQESLFLKMYGDFRLAMKEGEILAHELLDQQAQRLQAAKASLSDAQAAVDGAVDRIGADFGRLTLSRDEASRAVAEEDGLYQIAKDLADQLATGYMASEFIMARVNQIHAVKRRVHERMVSFFSTNETVFTGLDAAFTAQQGLHETTATQDAMLDGINKSLEAISTDGNELLKRGIKAGYGATIAFESMQKLVDSVVNWQSESIKEIENARQESTETAAKIVEYGEAGKKRFAALVQGAPASGALTHQSV